jgi:hypothetical protein
MRELALVILLILLVIVMIIYSPFKSFKSFKSPKFSQPCTCCGNDCSCKDPKNQGACENRCTCNRQKMIMNQNLYTDRNMYLIKNGMQPKCSCAKDDKREHFCPCEHLISPGYSNRSDVSAAIDQTFGGTDKYFSKDPRFAI